MKIVWKYPDLRYQIEETNRLAKREGFTQLEERKEVHAQFDSDIANLTGAHDLHRTHERSAINYAMQQQLSAMQAQAASAAAAYQQKADSIQYQLQAQQAQMQAQQQADSFRHQLQMQNIIYLHSHPEQFPELKSLYGNLTLSDPYRSLPWNRSKNIKFPPLKKLLPDSDDK